jgi:hypothetical protein
MSTQEENVANTLNRLSAPTVPTALEGGLLPIESLVAPVVVNFPVWAAAEPHYTYQLVLDGERVPPEKVIQETDQPGNLLTVEIPVSLLTDGVRAVSYRVYSPFADSEVFSESTHIEIDRTAPGAPDLAPIIFPSEIQGGLTSDELAALDDVLLGRIAGYNGMKVGDTIRTYWGAVDGPMAMVDADDMGLSRVMVRFSRAFLENMGDGQQEVYYTVTDRAGNLSERAEAVPVELKLLLMTPLPLPNILEADNGILDPVNTSNGATVVIDASANLRQGDFVQVMWDGPNGSDDKQKVIGAADAGKSVSVVFSKALVDVNIGQQIKVYYRVTRANGWSQDSEQLSVMVASALLVLPAPTMDTVQNDDIVNPALIPATGATVRVRYEMRADDRVKVIWVGTSRHETAEQAAGGGTTELVFQLPKALIEASENAQAVLSYQVSRAGVDKESERRTLTVRSALSFNTAPVTLDGQAFLVPAHPDVLPTLPAGTSVERVATGGTPPYAYGSSNPLVAHVSETGLATVRGKGSATISVTDAAGQSLSYEVTVTGVVQCFSLGTGKFGDMSAAAGQHGGRLPTIHELRAIYGVWGNKWPLVKNQTWSSTQARVTPFGKTYYVKNLGNGAEVDAYTYSAIAAIGIR